jgi:transposase InsO family protein
LTGAHQPARPVTACDLLYDRVLPFYEALGVPIGAILTDNGREFCGRVEQHPYELLLGVEGIGHRTTRVHTPRTNGFVERMNRTLLDECFRVAGRTTWYLEPTAIQEIILHEAAVIGGRGFVDTRPADCCASLSLAISTPTGRLPTTRRAGSSPGVGESLG